MFHVKYHYATVDFTIITGPHKPPFTS